jgi:mRNA-degrading endonuclease toxin of MazEF toxin-antitoxin module
MKRGEIWTLRDDRYAAKVRPVVVVLSDPGENPPANATQAAHENGQKRRAAT